MVRMLITRQFEDGRFFYMMLSLFMFIGISPFLGSTGHFENTVRSVFITFILISGLYGFWKDKKHIIRIGALSLPYLIFVWLRTLVGGTIFLYINPILGVAFYIYVTYLLFKGLLRTEKITSETLYGVVCVYLLIGILFSSIYALTDTISPGSFENATSGDYIYFSFITLTTVGYGEIIPLSPLARSFAMIESIMGVLYTTIIIARMVGLYLHDKKGLN